MIMTIKGRVGRDPELSITPTGKKLARYSLAVNGWNSDTREETTTWYEISAFDRHAVIANQSVHKGMSIYVTGRHSTFVGTKGTINQLAANEQGHADRFFFDEEDATEEVPEW